MSIEKKTLPVAPWVGLYVDGITVPGGLSEAENIEIMDNGWAKRRLATRTLADALTVKASKGFKELTEFRNAAGTRYLFADLDVSTTMSIKSGDVTGTTDYEVGTWADVITGLTAGTAILPQYATFQNRLFRVDGTNSQYVFTTNSAYTLNGVAAPAAAPTVSSGSAGSITPSEYNCYYTYVRKDGTYTVESDPCPVANITIAGNSINVTIVSSSDTSVTHVRLYRTLYGLADGYAYYEKEIAKATYVATPIQEFTAADSALSSTQLEFDNDAPPKAIGMAVSGGHMFYLTKTAVYWSKIDEPEHVPPTWYSTIDPNDSDIGMGIAAMQNYVLAFKRHKTFMFDANSAEVVDGNVGIARHVLSTKIGCRAQNSIQSCGEQNCIVWLSMEGVMKWAGGEITNISKNRVNSIIDSFMNVANSEYFVDSAYYNKKYHLLLVARNAALDAITSERHLVYNFDTDSWTEYKYYATDNTTQYYEVNLAVATDSNNKDVFLSTHLIVVGGTTGYLYQTDYVVPPTTDTATALGGDFGETPPYIFCDSSDNVYTITRDGKIYKTTQAAVQTTVTTAAAVKAAFDSGYTTTSDAYGDGYWNPTAAQAVFDSTNSCFYIKMFGSHFDSTLYNGGLPSGPYIYWRYAVVRVATSGTVTLIKAFSQYLTPWTYSATYNYAPPPGIGYQSNNFNDMVLDSTGANMFVADRGILYKIATPAGTPTVSTYYSFTGHTTSAQILGIDLFGNNMYILYREDCSENMPYYTYEDGHPPTDSAALIGAFNDVTSTADFESSSISYSGSFDPSKLLAISDNELYTFSEGYSGDKNIVRLLSSMGSWIAGAVGIKCAYFAYSAPRMATTTTGNFAFAAEAAYSGSVISVDSLVIYNKDWELIHSTDISSASYLGPVVNQIGTVADEAIFYGIIYTGGETPTYKLYKIFTPLEMVYEWNSTWDTDYIKGTPVKIVSNYEDLGIANDKRVRRAQVNIMADYPVCGSFSLEPDYSVNTHVHTNNEAAEPSGSVSRAIFTTDGDQTWNTTGSFSSGTVENWEISRLDVEAQGNKFRYCIKMGDISTNQQGTLYIKPPLVDAQIKGKY